MNCVPRSDMIFLMFLIFYFEKFAIAAIVSVDVPPFDTPAMCMALLNLSPKHMQLSPFFVNLAKSIVIISNGRCARSVGILDSSGFIGLLLWQNLQHHTCSAIAFFMFMKYMDFTAFLCILPVHLWLLVCRALTSSFVIESVNPGSVVDHYCSLDYR